MAGAGESDKQAEAVGATDGWTTGATVAAVHQEERTAAGSQRYNANEQQPALAERR